MADPMFENNPWAEEFWNLTTQGAYIRKYGVEVAKTKARAVGAALGDLKPKSMRSGTIERHWIIQKKIGAGGGQGSSGSGTPT